MRGKAPRRGSGRAVGGDHTRQQAGKSLREITQRDGVLLCCAVQCCMLYAERCSCRQLIQSARWLVLIRPSPHLRAFFASSCIAISDDSQGMSAPVCWQRRPPSIAQQASKHAVS